MNNTIDILFGHGENLTPLQMAVRAAITFFITLILIRIGGVRIFGKRSGFDTIIMITMGSVLARGIVGASPYLSTIAAATAMIVVHRFLAWLSIKSKKMEAMIKGQRTVLYDGSKIIFNNLRKASLSEEDLLESLRLETKHTSLEKVDKAFIETNGRISFILKKNES